MRALRSLLIGILGAALWPSYVGLLAVLAGLGPWPRAVAAPSSFVLTGLGLGLFAANLAGVLFRPDGWAPAVAGLPADVARQARRALLGLAAAGVWLLIPMRLFTLGLIAPSGQPVTAPTLARLFGLGFEVIVWVVAYRLVRSRSELVRWLRGDGLTPRHWLVRHQRLAGVGLRIAIAVVIGLDALGYGFTAHRLAIGGAHSALLAFACWGAYSLICRAIEAQSWRWHRGGTRAAAAEQAAGLDHPHELPDRLRRMAGALIPILGLLVGAWIWNVDMALFRTLGATPLMPIDEARTLTLGDLTEAGVLLALTVGLWRYMGTVFAVAIFPRMPDDPGVRFAAVTLCRYAVLGAGGLAGLSSLHLGLEQIGMVLAALGVGLGFGLQEIVANFVSGIILLLERPIRVGDIVTVDDMSGRVDQINIRATTIINWDNQSIIIPNREFITGKMVNWTHKDRVIRVSIRVGVAYGTCPDKVSDLLLTIARDDAEVLRNPVPGAVMEAFGDSSLNFALHVHVAEPGLGPRVRHRLSGEIQRRFRDAGISIPFPTRELHLRTVPDDLAPAPPPSADPTRFDRGMTTARGPHLAQAAPPPVIGRCVDE